MDIRNFTKDQLVTNRIYDSSGKQYPNSPIWTRYLFRSMGMMFNTPIIQKRLHFNTSTNLGYNNSYGYTSKGVSSIILMLKIYLGRYELYTSLQCSGTVVATFTHDVVEAGVLAIYGIQFLE